MVLGRGRRGRIEGAIKVIMKRRSSEKRS